MSARLPSLLWRGFLAFALAGYVVTYCFQQVRAENQCLRTIPGNEKYHFTDWRVSALTLRGYCTFPGYDKVPRSQWQWRMLRH